MVFLHEHEVHVNLAEDDPITLQQALQSSNPHKWINAIKNEMKSMKDNGVWDLFELLKGSKPIDCKWIFKTKRDSSGNVKRYEACLVAKGFTQKEGIDYKCDAPKFGSPLITHQPAECLWISCNSISHHCVPFTGIHNFNKNRIVSFVRGALSKI